MRSSRSLASLTAGSLSLFLYNRCLLCVFVFVFFLTSPDSLVPNRKNSFLRLERKILIFSFFFARAAASVIVVWVCRLVVVFISLIKFHHVPCRPLKYIHISFPRKKKERQEKRERQWTRQVLPLDCYYRRSEARNATRKKPTLATK